MESRTQLNNHGLEIARKVFVLPIASFLFVLARTNPYTRLMLRVYTMIPHPDLSIVDCDRLYDVLPFPIRSLCRLSPRLRMVKEAVGCTDSETTCKASDHQRPRMSGEMCPGTTRRLPDSVVIARTVRVHICLDTDSWRKAVVISTLSEAIEK